VQAPSLQGLSPAFQQHLKQLFANRTWAFVPVLSPEGIWGLGVAVAKQHGYYPIPLGECCAARVQGAYEAIAAYAVELNLATLGLEPAAAGEIIASARSAPAPAATPNSEDLAA
jgi:hypothetical protein